ncbi:GATA transcription factor [Striga asiatica]|uniref:GATA transcription factor n=1 Tax=Striga asiatica TaxID=4170 RepID=A0A5A7QQM1_STRAF|nr:GATA transcription factor [Striga asiatica]
MLYRTHHHPFFLYTFNPFSHSSLSHHLLSSASSHPLQKMECVQGALVSGFGLETDLKTASFLDDFSAVNGVSGDYLFVDELLDFSNDFNGEEVEEEEKPQKLEEPEEKQREEKDKTFFVPPEKPAAPEESAVSVKHDFGPLPESEELNVPAEGLESLEWLSHFVEDSFSDYSLTGKLSSTQAANRSEPGTNVKAQTCFSSPVQTKARTKRARTGVRVWPVLSPSFTESSTSSSSSASSAASFSFPTPNPLAVQCQTGEALQGKPPPPKKQKRKPADAGGSAVPQPRRCSHCGVTKTPQWRAGPLGSKTLCNACGVRFKSGRLLPEYRPACSPTFSSEIHSNNHRKVLEMRRQKESEIEPAVGLPPPVQSF